MVDRQLDQRSVVPNAEAVKFHFFLYQFKYLKSHRSLSHKLTHKHLP